MADPIVLSGGDFGGEERSVEDFDQKGELAIHDPKDAGSPTKQIHLYRLTEDKVHAVFVGIVKK